MSRKYLWLVLGALVIGAGAVLLYSTTRQSEEAVLMKIATIKGNPDTEEMVVILQETAGNRILPISIGQDQALAIHLGHQKIPSPRPLTHDLMAEMMKLAQLKVDRVVITNLHNGTYYAEVRVQAGKSMHVLDARPSDAIALSLRVHAAIYAMPNLLQEALEYTGDEESDPQTELPTWGFAVQTLTPDLASVFSNSAGVLVADVLTEGPAAQQGLQAGDLILRVNDLPVMNVQQVVDHLTEPAPQQVALEIARGNTRHKLVITPVQ